MQTYIPAFQKFLMLQEQLISAMDQDNLARVKNILEVKIPACEEQINKLLGPATRMMRDALHDRWPNAFEAPYSALPGRVEIRKDEPEPEPEPKPDAKSTSAAVASPPVKPANDGESATETPNPE
jgi:hypothetical protein